MILALISDFMSSIKSPDTEEKLDLIIYRPLGYVIARGANSLKMTPIMLSLLGLAFGLQASFFFLQNNTTSAFWWGSFYFILSGVLDSSDGQLARISNQSSKAGLIIDGICDSLVIIAIYAACTWPFIKAQGLIYIFMLMLALYLHSCQCAILDFYHREYLYFGYGKTENNTYWNPSFTDSILQLQNSQSQSDKILNYLRSTWIRKQQFLTTRTSEQRAQMQKYILNGSNDEKKYFMDTYKKHNLWLLPYWRLVGVNAHTIVVIIFMFLHRFDLYLILFDLIIFNLIVLGVRFLQKESDQSFFTELAQNLNVE